MKLNNKKKNLMLKIGTHDSATGEMVKWYCIPLIPFSRTQSKTIKEQYEAGCRGFDIRVRRLDGDWHCVHGFMFTERKAEDIIKEINSFEERCQVSITYEGGMENNEDFKLFVIEMKALYKNIIYGGIAVKYGSQCKGLKVCYEYLMPCDKEYQGGTQGFLPLNGRTWHTYLPLPWLWDRIYKRPHVFNENTFTYVDFL